MKIIKVTATGETPEISALLLRQSPGGKGVWGDCRFFINQPVERCDWWVVCHYSALRDTETAYCDPDHVIYVSMEPFDSMLPREFLSQFARVVLCDRVVDHPSVLHRNGLSWWVGLNIKHAGGHTFLPECSLDYDALCNMQGTGKSKFISVICSNKAFMDGHRQRIGFVKKLLSHPISRHIDFYGGGFNPVLDKWDAIAPYKYHIALENSVMPDYWTEKLADAFLGFSYPIYYGCPNIHDYFDREALRIIDINDFDRSVAILTELLEQDPYRHHLPAIVKARQKVLDDYNLFQLMADICDGPAVRPARCQLKPWNYFRPVHG